MLIVQKFGGSSLADAEKLALAAETVAEAYHRGDGVVTVVSARGDATDVLIGAAREISSAPEPRELDALLAVGEQESAALLAMELCRREIPAVSLSGAQLGVLTDSVHGDARILRVDTRRLRGELESGRTVVAAGFQGVDAQGDITTLGRGGSDTTAVALASALGAPRCRIYKDVDGVYTADPRTVPSAKRLDGLAWNEMLALASLGSRVLHDRCVALAMRRGVSLEVLTAGTGDGGTLVGDFPAREFSGVTRCGEHVSLVGAGALPGTEAERRMLDALRGICPDTQELTAGTLSLTASVPKERAEEALRAVHDAFFL